VIDKQWRVPGGKRATATILRESKNREKGRGEGLTKEKNAGTTIVKGGIKGEKDSAERRENPHPPTKVVSWPGQEISEGGKETKNQKFPRSSGPIYSSITAKSFQ